MSRTSSGSTFAPHSSISAMRRIRYPSAYDPVISPRTSDEAGVLFALATHPRSGSCRPGKCFVPT